ncbi:MAG TPA: hypothetical protein VFL36_16230 [Myxococcales bacterium]|nr:hypothetical protein [Myxococcales bacterium]
MNSRRHGGNFEELEALIYRLFAEKQFALALLALVMVAQLLSAQFLLLRLRPPSAQAAAAPSSRQRLDVRCEAGGARTLAGDPLQSARGKVVVVHLGAPEAACLSQVTSAGASELVVGIETDARSPSR